jgi:hypothetical protein
VVEKDLGINSWYWAVGAFPVILFLWLLPLFDPNDPSQLYKKPDSQLNPANEDLRLLIVEPGNWADPITCRLEKHGLASQPPYTALSYAWVENYPTVRKKRRLLLLEWIEWLVGWLEQQQWRGTLKYYTLIFGDSRKSIILVNGRRHEVGVNLELALRHLRRKPPQSSNTANRENGETNRNEVYLWADAVCINQDDQKDRSRQVKSMHLVYQEAIGVEIWLGIERDFRQPDCDNCKDTYGKRDEPTITKDPRDGIDVVWGQVNIDDSERRNGSEEQNIPTDDDVRLDEVLKNWDTFHNRPKLLRANIGEDYTMEFFCMIHLLQKRAFEGCYEQKTTLQPSPESEDGSSKKRVKIPLEQRIPFLKQATNRAHVLEVFAEVMGRLWWNRLWVVQETVIAKKVDIRYGRFVIPWSNLVLAANNLKDHRHKPCCVEGFESLPSSDVDILMKFADIVLGLNTWRKSWNEDAGTADIEIRLLRLLWYFRERHTSEPRDKIYALLPLVSRLPGKRGYVTPDYELSVAEVYKSVVRNLIRTEDSLAALAGNASKSKKLGEILPTWAPDWSEQPKPGELFRLERMTLYDADGRKTFKREFKWRILGDNKFLELRGIKCSVVKKTAAVMGANEGARSDAKSKETFQEWEELAELKKKGRTTYQGCDYDRETAYFKTMAMDTVYRGKVTDSDNVEIDKLDFRRAPPHYGVGMKDWETYANKGRERTKTYNYGSDNFLPINRHSPSSSLSNSESDKYAGAMKRSGEENPSTSTPATAPLVPTAIESPVAQGFDIDPGPIGQIRLGRRNSPEETLATMVDENNESATASRRFFVTESGHMGLGPEDTKVGDVVFVLVGSPVPFLLRDAGQTYIDKGRNRPQSLTPQRSDRSATTNATAHEQSSSDSHKATGLQRALSCIPWKKHPARGRDITQCYTLIGDCYVQGIMDGEATRNVEADDVYLI